MRITVGTHGQSPEFARFAGFAKSALTVFLLYSNDFDKEMLRGIWRIRKTGVARNRRFVYIPFCRLRFRVRVGRREGPNMRKSYFIAIAAAIVAGGAYWYSTRDTVDPNPAPSPGNGSSQLTKQLPSHNGNTEESDAIEPLIVDHGTPPTVVTPVIFCGPLSRVESHGRENQPPRPDVESGRARRMPYADEVVIPGIAFDPIIWILESKLPDLNLFGGVEESEPNDLPPAAPIWHPHAYPHCPRVIECPMPARFR
jgi:hypothetical protein